jgi:sarcosine oxidase subunit beta
LDYLQHLSPFWEKVVKGLKKPDVKVSAGQYVYTPDLQPLLGPVEEIKGLYLSCGYWCGVMIAPAVGDWMAKIITNEMEPEKNPLSVQRFKGGGGKTAGSLLSR